MKSACLLLVFLLAPAAGAQSLTALDRGSFGVGLFHARISLDGEVVAEGTVDNRARRFADDFALGDYREFQLAELSWSPWERHELAVRALRDSYSQTVRLQEELRFDQQTFPVDVDLRARMSLTALEFDYTWWAYATPRSAVGMQLGLLRLGAQVSLRGAISSADNGDLEIDASASDRLYAPLIGITGRQVFGDRLRGYIKLRAIELRHGRIDGTALSFGAGLEWFFTERWGVMLQYADTRIRADHDRGFIDGRLEFGLRGTQLLLKRHW
jgi:hypothetical protein